MIHYRNAVRKSGVNGRALVATARRLLAAVGEDDASLSVTLVGDDAIRTMNLEHRGKDRATDVLSFPMDVGRTRRRNVAPVPERLLGDVVISVPTALRQAADYDAPLQDELYRLLIHGVLHVLGHDHTRAGERRTMEREERRLADAIALRWPYEATR
ncbi:MAG TPA: rRNA maturation RNase YbeY [Candidatus Tumulicola sp.]